jgi:hypothetical protein
MNEAISARVTGTFGHKVVGLQPDVMPAAFRLLMSV